VLRPTARLSTELIVAILDFVVERPPRATTARLWPVVRTVASGEDARAAGHGASASGRGRDDAYDDDDDEASSSSSVFWNDDDDDRVELFESDDPLSEERAPTTTLAAVPEQQQQQSRGAARGAPMHDVRIDGDSYAVVSSFDALRADGAGRGPFAFRGHWVPPRGRSERRSFLCVEPAPLEVTTTSWSSLRADRVDWLRRVRHDDGRGDRVVCCSVTRGAVGALVERSARAGDAATAEQRQLAVDVDAIGYDLGAAGRAFAYVRRGAAVSRRIKDRFTVRVVAYHRLAEFALSGCATTTLPSRPPSAAAATSSSRAATTRADEEAVDDRDDVRGDSDDDDAAALDDDGGPEEEAARDEEADPPSPGGRRRRRRRRVPAETYEDDDDDASAAHWRGAARGFWLTERGGPAERTRVGAPSTHLPIGDAGRRAGGVVVDDDDDDDGFIQEDEEIRHPAASVVSSSSSSAQGPGGPSSAPARASLARGRKDDAGGGVGPAAVARDPRRRWSAVPA